MCLKWTLKFSYSYSYSYSSIFPSNIHQSIHPSIYLSIFCFSLSNAIFLPLYLYLPGVDIDCYNQVYLMVLLVQTTTASGFEPLECKNPNFYTTCPAGFACVANSRTGRYICCTGKPDAQSALALTSRVNTNIAQKAGTCPSVRIALETNKKKHELKISRLHSPNMGNTF